jgi:hypothetical protein
VLFSEEDGEPTPALKDTLRSYINWDWSLAVSDSPADAIYNPLRQNNVSAGIATTPTQVTVDEENLKVIDDEFRFI